MRTLLLFLIIILNTQEILAQVSPVFQFELDKITIQQAEAPTDISLKVFKGNITATEMDSKNSIIGKIGIRKSIVMFYPFVPFNMGQDYTMLYNNEISYFQIPIASDYQRLDITSIFPSKITLPANILKWYIQFSQPVSSANIYDHIYFLDKNGEKISRAILPLENALLDEESMLLTVWIEPGRQKRGLGPNERLGSVFEIGQPYSLVISKNLSDKNGIEMHEDIIHHFSISNNDRISPNPQQWEIKFPSTDSKNALQINFKESMDYGSAQQAFKIIDSSGEEIIGAWTWTTSESILSFTPEKNWTSGHYEIIVLTSIEDLAGNNLNRLFDGAVRSKNEVLETDVVLEFEVF